MDEKHENFPTNIPPDIAEMMAAIDSESGGGELYKNEDKYPEWIMLGFALKIKGGATYSTCKKSPWLQPCCGSNSKKVGGCRVWHKAHVIEWLSITDDLLWEYSQKWDVKIPDKYHLEKSG
ncbi:hypothetical protein FACS189485_19510 [Spirochaetia bacterium]|nr:hypothetical protein FACS189485_19510 [Spirochaetia bacterium]